MSDAPTVAQLKVLDIEHTSYHCRLFTLQSLDALDWALGRASGPYRILSVRFNGHFPGEPGLAGVY